MEEREKQNKQNTTFFVVLNGCKIKPESQTARCSLSIIDKEKKQTKQKIVLFCDYGSLSFILFCLAM